MRSKDDNKRKAGLHENKQVHADHAPSRKRQFFKLSAVTLVLSLIGVGFFFTHENTPAVEPTAHTSSNGGFAFTPPLSMSATLPSAPLPPSIARQVQAKELETRYSLVEHTLCNYREATKYPTQSRPIAEHPDQIYPNQPIAESHGMRDKNGKVNKEYQIQTTQTRVYVGAREAVTFTIAARDHEGKLVDLFVTRALAQGLTFKDQRAAPQQAIALADTGRDGDQTAGDKTASGTLAPANTSFANFDGTIRTEVNYTVNGQAGAVIFDIIYTPSLPATWNGKIKETVEEGSLIFTLPLNVQTAGRYLVNARVDDAKNTPFAMLSYNELLPQGNNEIRLKLAGNLLRDKKPEFPLHLRDIDAYLLKEDTDPDRALMSRMEGIAHISKTYPLKVFSEAEWMSEERARHLKEFSKDVNLAKAALVEFDAEQAQGVLARSACGGVAGLAVR